MFRASRLSRGNRLFPTQVLITPTTRRPLHAGAGRPKRTFDPHRACRVGQHRHQPVVLERAHRDQRRHDPVRCHGHRKSDAVRMKQLIEQHQTQYLPERPAGARRRQPRWRVDDVTFAAHARQRPGGARPELPDVEARFKTPRAVAAARRHPAVPERAARRSVRHRSDHADVRPHAAGRRQLHPRAGRVRRRQEDRRRPGHLRRGAARARGRREAARHLPRAPRQPRRRRGVAVGAALPRDDRARREDARHLRVDSHRRQVGHLGADPRAHRRRARKSWPA